MAQVAPTMTQIRAHVQRVQKNADRMAGLVVGIRSAVRWSGGDSFAVDGHQYDISWCTGPLEMRQRLADSVTSGRGLVVVTPLDDHAVGADVLARLAKSRLDPIRPWELLLEQFQVQRLDPQVTAQQWMINALIGVAPTDGIDAVPTGVLDLATAWKVLLSRVLGVKQYPLDLVGLLHWTRDADGLQRYADAGDAFRRGVRDHLIDTCGLAAGAVLDCIEAGFGGDAVAVGLVCRTVFHASGGLEPSFAVGAARLERYTLDHPLTPAAGRQWAAAAELVVRQISAANGLNAARPLLGRGDQILREIKADDQAHLSDVLPDGFERRLHRYAVELGRWLDGRTQDRLAALVQAAIVTFGHDEARLPEGRVQRVSMSVRLAQYLARGVPPSTSPVPFEPLALHYAREGGFVDWARSVLPGEGQATLAAAYTRLAGAVTAVRESENQTFAASLAEWTATGVQPRNVLRIEDVLDRVVAPVAEKAPVLLLVLDGMSFAVYRELLDDLATRRGWVQVTESAETTDRPVLATIPSKTEYSRTSLFCGKLAAGGQSESHKGFASHPTLVAASRSGGDPLLFHKAELTDGPAGNLTSELRKAIKSNRRVIGVVVNAVDDHLAKGDQVQPHWTVDYIRVLGPLLHESALAGRLVILASDHGHVFDRQAKFEKSDEGERWRSATGSAESYEVVVSGPRVMAGGGRLIALWSEQVHFGGKRHGYHGGLSPQEMLAPLAVLVPGAAKRPDGWGEVGLYSPSWWDIQTPEMVGPAASKEGTAAPPARPVKTPRTLFDPMPPVPSVTVASVNEPVGQDWVDPLLASPVFEAQRKLAGRTPVADVVVRAFLAALADRGGKMLRPALAKQLNVPPLRLPGLIVAMRRALNLDGVDVLTVDDASDSVVLDMSRLKVQFDLE
jgi:hypothetical protein